jgi:lysozyme
VIDLSNVNGEPNFTRVYQTGQRRVYMKVDEGRTFVDPDYLRRRARARRAGLKVGGYHFAKPHQNTPAEEVHGFIARLQLPSTQERPCLDLEDGASTHTVGRWAVEFYRLFKRATGITLLFYSYPSYIASLGLTVPLGPLWLASFGRNDGQEHPFLIPRPWTAIAAHQYSSNARVAGVPGRVDISHVFRGWELDLAPPVGGGSGLPAAQ